MTLENIKGMTEYLENDCYCPYEIYDTSGFFYQLFKPETPCELLAESKYGEHCLIFVAARPSDEFGSDKYPEEVQYDEKGHAASCWKMIKTLYEQGKIDIVNGVPEGKPLIYNGAIIANQKKERKKHEQGK